MTDHDNFLLGLSQRLPPSNTGAEQALLGALMSNNQACRHVESFLQARHFADPIHRLIFDAIMTDYRASRLVDAITLRSKFEHTSALDDVGGTAYLAQLATAPVGIINAGEYGRSIHDAWMRRELIDIGEEIVNRAFGADPEMDAAAQWDAATQRLARLPEGSATMDRAEAADSVRDPVDAFTEVEIVDGKAVDMRDPDAVPYPICDEHGALVSYGGGPDMDIGPAYLPLRQAGQP